MKPLLSLNAFRIKIILEILASMQANLTWCFVQGDFVGGWMGNHV